MLYIHIMITFVLWTLYLLVNLLFTACLLALISNFVLSKGCSRRSWNIRPTRTKRFSRRPRAHRRTWSTRCKGNTRTWHFPFWATVFPKVSLYCSSFLSLCFKTFSTGSYWDPRSSRCRGKTRTTGNSEYLYILMCLNRTYWSFL